MFAPPMDFQRVWSIKNKKGQDFHGWAPIPPADDFVALGHVVTTVRVKPTHETFPAVRVVHKGILRGEPIGKELWSDRGCWGSDDGSVWRMPVRAPRPRVAVNHPSCIFARLQSTPTR